MKDENEHPVLIYEVKPTQLYGQLACFSPRESKFSKWWNSNFIINWTLLLLFYIISTLLEFTSVLDVRMLLWKINALLTSLSRTQLVTSRV